MFEYVRIYYTNRDGKKQPPFRKIFLITPSTINKSSYDATYDEYINIKNFLVNKKLW